ncbi:MAG TPA: AccI family restriction endonuclease [Candidatus Paceibacterota bacterium]|nr:AccI family restriction endonuclease [Candidatus Paceibacterota bacterium]
MPKKKRTRRLRGSDFLMRWSQGAWSEDQLVDAVNATQKFFALPYGPSGTAPDDDPVAYEKYFERLDAAGLGSIKRPDLLIFPESARSKVNSMVEPLGGVAELPFHTEDEEHIKALLSLAIMAVECENSLWKAKQMPNYTYTLKPQKRLGGKPGLAKNAVLPTIIMKDEDRGPLTEWQKRNPKLPLHIWHAFFDEAYGISFADMNRLIDDGTIEPSVQEFSNAGQPSTKKTLYKAHYYLGYPLATSTQDPALKAQTIVDKNGHIYPYVTFSGGKMALRDDAVRVLESL